MFTLERQNEIVELLKTEKSISVNELSKHFFTGEATIRRDLDKLEKQNLIKRTYGGAIIIDNNNSEIPLHIRKKEHSKAKSHIGKLASNLIYNGDSIIIDSSSTSFAIIDYLKNKENLTVITNGLKSADYLGDILHKKVYCTGGILRENSSSLVGEQASLFINSYSVQKLFFSCRALSLTDGAMDLSDEEASLRRHMINKSREVILLCDSSKFNKTAFSKICDYSKITHIITDQKPDNEFIEILKNNNITLLY